MTALHVDPRQRVTHAVHADQLCREAGGSLDVSHGPARHVLLPENYLLSRTTSHQAPDLPDQVVVAAVDGVQADEPVLVTGGCQDGHLRRNATEQGRITDG